MIVESPENLISLGKRIRFLRGRRTAPEYAAELGVHPNTLLNYEKGERPPNSHVLSKLCQLEQVDANWLLWGTAGQEKAGRMMAYKRDLLETIGNLAHEQAPNQIGSRFGKMLTMAYEQAALNEKLDHQKVRTIIRDLVDLLEPKSKIGRHDGNGRNPNQDSCAAC